MELRVALLMLAVTSGLALPTLFGANLHKCVRWCRLLADTCSGLENFPNGLYALWALALLITVSVGRAGFKALSMSRRSAAYLPRPQGESAEARRRLEVLQRHRAAQEMPSA